MNSLSSRRRGVNRGISRIVAALVLSGGLVCVPFASILAQTSINASAHTLAKKVKLPPVVLTQDIVAYQILSDLAMNRSEYAAAYQGYLHLAQQTKDPRYAERALLAATLNRDQNAVLTATHLLSALEANTPLTSIDPRLNEQLTLARILEWSKNKQLDKAQTATQDFLKTQPNHTIAWALLADFSHSLGDEVNELLAYETLYRLSPKDPEVMNNLAFFLAEKNLRLDEAQQLVTQALVQQPKAAHIIDTAAWVAYRQARLNDALTLSLRAYELNASSDIALHLAELLWVNGQQDEAQLIFNKLLANPNPKSADSAVQQRIQLILDRLNTARSSTH